MNPTFVKEKSGFFYATVVFNLAEDENIELTEVNYTQPEVHNP